VEKIVVGGGCGFIGSSLVSRILDGGVRATAVDNLSTGHPQRIKNDRYQFQKGDLSSARFTRTLFQEIRPDCYVHVAGMSDPLPGEKNPVQDIEKSVFPLLNILRSLEEAGGTGHFILISTGEVFGEENEPLPGETETPRPGTSYGVSYLMMEHYLSVYARRLKMPFSILRLSPVYGPGQSLEGETGQMTYWVRAMFRQDKGEMPRLTGNGMRVRDFVFVEDAVDAIFAVALEKKSGVFHLGSGISASERDIFAKMKEVSGVPLDISYENAYSHGPQKRILGYRRLEEELGWSPSTSLDEGVSQTVSWFRRWLG
jgi:UDP-glucose 4-epimerase